MKGSVCLGKEEKEAEQEKGGEEVAREVPASCIHARNLCTSHRGGDTPAGGGAGPDKNIRHVCTHETHTKLVHIPQRETLLLKLARLAAAQRQEQESSSERDSGGGGGGVPAASAAALAAAALGLPLPTWALLASGADGMGSAAAVASTPVGCGLPVLAAVPGARRVMGVLEVVLGRAAALDGQCSMYSMEADVLANMHQ